MTSSQQAFDYIVSMIVVADTYFAFKVVDLGIEHYGKCFTEMKKQKSELIDMRCDRWKDVFNPKPTVILKNLNNNETGTGA